MSGLLDEMRSQSISSLGDLLEPSSTEKSVDSCANCFQRMNALFKSRPNATRIALSRLGIFCLLDVRFKLF